MATTCEKIKCTYFKDGKCTDDGMLKWVIHRATAEHNGMLIKILRAKDTYDLCVYRREGLIKFIGDFPSLEAAQQKAEEVLKELEAQNG